MQVIRKNPKTLFDPSPYGFCQTISTPTNGRYIFVSGQFGDENAALEISNDFRTQVKTTLKNLSLALESNESSVDDIIKITVLVVDHSNERLEILSEELLNAWGEKYPTSTLIPVPRLALDGMLIEIDAIAFKNESNESI